MHEITFIEKEFCCGCGACFVLCPTKAIEMKTDFEGFMYPWICESKCIHCGKCERTCPIKRKLESVLVGDNKSI